MTPKLNNSYRIGTTADLAALIPLMNKAVERRVHMEGVNDPTQGSAGYWDGNTKAIVNSVTGNKAQIVSPGYQILQHDDFFGGIVELLQDDARQVYGVAHETDNGNCWKVRVIFDDIEAAHEGGMGKNVKIGAEFTNSYNSMSSANGNGYYMRSSCTNQMTLKNLIQEISFSRNHFSVTPSALLEDAIARSLTFINGVGNMAAPLERIITSAQNAKVSFLSEADAAATFTKMFGTKVAGNAIAANLHNAFACGHDVSRWEIYNAATDYASHGNKVSMTTADNILGFAERKVLNIRSPIEMILASPVMAVA